MKIKEAPSKQIKSSRKCAKCGKPTTLCVCTSN